MKKSNLKHIVLGVLMSLGLLVSGSAMGQLTTPRTVTFSGVDFAGTLYKETTRDGAKVIGRNEFSNSAGHNISCVTPNGSNNACTDLENNRRRIEFQLVSNEEKITRVEIVFKARAADAYVCVVNTENTPEPFTDYSSGGDHVYELLNGGFRTTPSLANANDDNCTSPAVLDYSDEKVRKIILSKIIRWKDDTDGQFVSYSDGNSTGFTNELSAPGSFVAEVTLTIDAVLTSIAAEEICAIPTTDNKIHIELLPANTTDYITEILVNGSPVSVVGSEPKTQEITATPGMILEVRTSSSLAPLVKKFY